MADVKLNRKFADQLAKSPEFQQGMRKIAEIVADSVKANAPKGGTGYYRRKVSAFQKGDVVGVKSEDHFAHLIEFGSAKNPAYAPMRRGVRAAGLRLEQSPKQ